MDFADYYLGNYDLSRWANVPFTDDFVYIFEFIVKSHCNIIVYKLITAYT